MTNKTHNQPLLDSETPAQIIKRLKFLLSDEQLKNSILNEMVDTLTRIFHRNATYLT